MQGIPAQENSYCYALIIIDKRSLAMMAVMMKIREDRCSPMTKTLERKREIKGGGH